MSREDSQMTKRVVQAVLHRHGPFTLVFCTTEQPYGIIEYGKLKRDAEALPSGMFGGVSMELHESPTTPTIQRFGIYSDRKGLNRQQAERMVRRAFPDCTVSTTWENDIRQLRAPFGEMALKQLLKLAGQ
jgi:hypothetical protein